MRGDDLNVECADGGNHGSCFLLWRHIYNRITVFHGVFFMKRMVGFIMFWIAVGMIVKFFMQNGFWSVIVMLALLLGGYNLFCCD